MAYLCIFKDIFRFGSDKLLRTFDWLPFCGVKQFLRSKTADWSKLRSNACDWLFLGFSLRLYIGYDFIFWEPGQRSDTWSGDRLSLGTMHVFCRFSA